MRKKIKVRNFEFYFDPKKTENVLRERNPPTGYEPLEEYKEGQEIIDNDKKLVESFKKSILNKDIEVNFIYIGFYLISGVILVLSAFYELVRHQKTLYMGINEIRGKSLFKDEGICGINYYDDYLNPSIDAVTCKLLFNPFYRISQLLLWYYFVIMFILVIIALIQLGILVLSEEKRLERLAQLLPDIDKDSLQRFTKSKNSYFTLEEVSKTLDKPLFQRFVQQLIDEDYRLDLALKSVSKV